MMQPGILLDLTYFVNDPVRTGIQRVGYALTRHWQAAWPLIPVVVSPQGTLHRLPDAIFPLMHWFFQAPPDNLAAVGERIRSLAPPVLREPGIEVSDYPALLNPEVFFDDYRVAFYQNLLDNGLGARLFFCLFDLLPMLHPEWFAAQAMGPLMSYARLVRQLPNTCFISTKTRDDYALRLVRQERPLGPVVPLGSDGLGTADPDFDPRRRGFTMVGTLEPRKNHAVVLDAFERFWVEDVDVRLTFVGRKGWLATDVLERIHQLGRREPRFRWLDSLDDNGTREEIRASRATLYVSQGEGYGLPPLESLALGVPAIVTADLPSVRDLPTLGQIRLEDATAEEVYGAVGEILRDEVAERKTKEIRDLALPRWCELPQHFAGWLTACQPELATLTPPPPLVVVPARPPEPQARLSFLAKLARQIREPRIPKVCVAHSVVSGEW